ncbi:MAG: hypothetical protein ACIARR_11695 [Phycisphaerales bacterium JB059]
MTAEVEKTVSVRNHVVFFYDVLNQRQSLSQWNDLSALTNDQPKLAEALHQSVIKVAWLRDTLCETAIALTEDRTDPRILAQLGPTEQQELRLLGRAPIKAQHLSDATLLSAPCMLDNGKPSLKVIAGLVASAATVMLCALDREIVIRGAIEVGAGCDMFGDEIYGPCVATAYQLESEVAQYPRLVVGPNLADLVDRMRQHEDLTPYGAACRSIGRFTFDMFFVDQDGVLAIDYLGEGARKAAPLLAKQTDMFARVNEFVCSEHRRFTELGNQKLANRYGLMRQYFESRSPLWTEHKQSDY